MEEFTKKMEKILLEKEKIYQDTWKSCSLNILIYKLSKQIDALEKADKNRSKRIAIHISNYGYLIYQRLK